MKYLFIAAHTDDYELSCGGTISKLRQGGHQVTGVTLSYCQNETLMREWMDAAKVLDMSHGWVESYEVRNFDKYTDKMATYFYQLRDKYDFIFSHSDTDRHTDHKITGQQSKRIFNQNLFSYVGPWNAEENPNYFVEISQQQLDKKIQAIQCYKSQVHRKYMNPDFIRASAIYNGIKAGCEYAEAFTLVKGINFAQICNGFSNGTLRNATQPQEGGIQIL